MGQYWMPVNLDKREFIDPHKLGTGLKLLEQAWNSPGTPAALLLLTAAMPEPRGGGDPAAHPAIGRWAGDRIAIVGDYAEDADLPNSPVPAGIIYGLCGERLDKWRDHLSQLASNPEVSADERARFRTTLRQIKTETPFTDVSDVVAGAIEQVFGGKFTGSGWRTFVPNDSDTSLATPADE